LADLLIRRIHCCFELKQTIVPVCSLFPFDLEIGYLEQSKSNLETTVLCPKQC